MYAIAIIRYRRPLEEIEKVVDEHRAYLRSLKSAGMLLTAGPMDPRSGGMLLLRVPDENTTIELNKIRDNDPYTINNLAQYELIPWAPVIGKEGLDSIVA